jgi:hypothetical protein
MTTAKNDPHSAQSAAIQKSLHQTLTYIGNEQKDGWWPFISNRQASTEATAWCALATTVTAESANAKHVAALDYLLKCQNKDGGWSTGPDITISEWCTAPALLAVRMLAAKCGNTSPRVRQAIDRAQDFLFEIRTDYWHRPIARLLVLLTRGQEGLNYGRGWPWMRDCAHWVEPTAYGLLALKLPHLTEKAGLREAAKHANLYFHEHACRAAKDRPPSGWNHGSNYCLEVYLPPYTVTTAEALVALQDDPDHDTVAGGLDHLLQANDDSNSAMALAWSTIALHAYGRDYKTKLLALVEQQNTDGSFGPNNLVTAVAAVALAAGNGTNILKFTRKAE